MLKMMATLHFPSICNYLIMKKFYPFFRMNTILNNGHFDLVVMKTSECWNME
jgi:hypothetical protein